jgi:hypothetical protein
MMPPHYAHQGRGGGKSRFFIGSCSQGKAFPPHKYIFEVLDNKINLSNILNIVLLKS